MKEVHSYWNYNDEALTNYLYHVGPLRKQEIIELIMQEEMLSLAINSFLPPTPSTINNFLEIIAARVVRIQYKKCTITTSIIVIYTQERICKNTTTCK